MLLLTPCVALLGLAAVAAGPDASKFDKDRAAILAMAGEFHVTFDFKETRAVAEGYELHKPYHEEATEMVEVVEDAGDRIVLQHILVIGGGEGKDPMIVKHWRQDWKYQDTRVFSYQSGDTWDVADLPAEEVAGTWTQAVYHVDDSPRYESYGAWEHSGDRSTWRSQETRRPLPRREHTKRSDYDVLIVTNTHVVTPDGWLHEQANDKLVIASGQVLAHEEGLNTYERIAGHDFSAGRQYWEQTRDFWAKVRAAWEDVLATHDRVTVREEIDGDSLNERIDHMVYEPADATRDQQVRAVLAAYIEG